jgi:hypothetical protein
MAARRSGIAVGRKAQASSNLAWTARWRWRAQREAYRHAAGQEHGRIVPCQLRALVQKLFGALVANLVGKGAKP